MPFRCVATEESEANNEKQQAAASTLSMLDWKLSLSFSGFLFVFFSALTVCLCLFGVSCVFVRAHMHTRTFVCLRMGCC